MEAREKLLLALQRALLGEVTPELRGVGVELVGSTSARIHFYFASASEGHDDTVGSVIAEVAADFAPEWEIHDLAEIKPTHEPLLADLSWAYRRRE